MRSIARQGGPTIPYFTSMDALLNGRLLFKWRKGVGKLKLRATLLSTGYYNKNSCRMDKKLSLK
jgi:hypothetical protein